MKREELEFVLKSNRYLEGGTKEACIKVRNFLNYERNPGDKLQLPMSCVTANEFAEAVETLVAFAFSQEDTIPERWKCENDCKNVHLLLCPGECNISKTADKICPYFMDEGDI